MWVRVLGDKLISIRCIWVVMCNSTEHSIQEQKNLHGCLLPMQPHVRLHMSSYNQEEKFILPRCNNTYCLGQVE